MKTMRKIEAFIENICSEKPIFKQVKMQKHYSLTV